MIYALGKSSGANFNPAVSLALGICDKLAWSEAWEANKPSFHKPLVWNG
jgi:glycerol uptake facilitator-like aquaporin